MKRLCLLLILLASPSFAQDIRFAPGITVTAAVTLTADANGVLQLDRTKPVTIGSIGTIPTVPTVPFPNPSSGLTAFAKTAVASAVQPYNNRDRDAVRLSAVYSAVVGLIDKGQITTSKQADAALKQAVDMALGFSGAGDKWNAWRATIAGQLNTMSIQNLAGVRSAYSEIAAGLSMDQIEAFAATAAGANIKDEITADDLLEAQYFDSAEAWGDGAFLKWLLEFLLPLILQLIKTGI